MAQLQRIFGDWIDIEKEITLPSENEINSHTHLKAIHKIDSFVRMWYSSSRKFTSDQTYSKNGF